MMTGMVSMDILEFAIGKEKVTEQYYRDLAEKTDNAGLAKIFKMLAEEELKHRHAIELMKQDIPHEIAETLLLEGAKKIFEKMLGSVDTFDFDIAEIDLYCQARDFEKWSLDFYIERSKEVENTWQEAIFLKLANEEQKHLALLQSICDFVATPECYLENAEFTHLEQF